MNKPTLKEAYMAGVVHTLLAINNDVCKLSLEYEQHLIEDFEDYINKQLLKYVGTLYSKN